MASITDPNVTATSPSQRRVQLLLSMSPHTCPRCTINPANITVGLGRAQQQQLSSTVRWFICLLVVLLMLHHGSAEPRDDRDGQAPGWAAQRADWLPSLSRFHNVLKTTLRREFGGEEDAFRLAVDWQHNRLLAADATAATATTRGGGGGGAREQTGVTDVYAQKNQSIKNSDRSASSDDTAASDDDTSAGSRIDAVHGGYGKESRGGGSGSSDGWGTFVAFASHGKARAARQFLEETFSDSSVATLSHTRRHGACFLVHANAAAVDALFLDDEEEWANGENAALFRGGIESEDRWRSQVTGPTSVAVGDEQKRGEEGGRWLLEGFMALPPNLKIAPTMLDHLGLIETSREPMVQTRTPTTKGGVGRERGGGEEGYVLGNDTPRTKTEEKEAKKTSQGGLSGQDSDLLTTSPGRAVHKDGLIVFLSPGSVAPGEERAVAERWRRGWGSPTLDLYSLSFWSDPQHGAPAATATGAPAKSPAMPPRGANTSPLRQETREGEAGAAKPVQDDDETAAAAAAASAVHVREWVGAARVVHSLSDSAGVTPAVACGWDRVRVSTEGPGFMTVRGIGHLLQQQHLAEVDTSAGAGGTSMPSQSPVLSDRERTSCLMGLVSFLASSSEAARVSPLPRAELFNAVASRLVQSATETRTPLWDRGVDGSGQVIQMVDSGVQEGSCYFANSASDEETVEHGYLLDEDETLGKGDFLYDLSRRKIIQYIEGVKGTFTYTADDPLGHGSHVTGSAAGSVYSDWDGPTECSKSGSEQSVVSCVGSCLSPTVLAAMPDDSSFNLDAWCPEYDCDTYWPVHCLSDDREETLKEASGVARGATIAVLDLGGSEGLHQVLGGHMWEAAAGTGARLHSGSWGFPDDPCEVDDASVSFDAWAYENPEHLLIFAAGNLGDDVTGCSISSPAIGKNCLAVGSSMSGAIRLSPPSGDMDDVSDFSSVGPTTDGRIKPDVVAPGHYVFSAANGGQGSCELQLNSGTSMSCPLTAGAAALVRQYFVDGFHSADAEARGLCSASEKTTAASDGVEFACEAFVPTGALIKAMLIHGANSMGGSTDPDGQRGFGRVHLESRMPFEGEGLAALYVEDPNTSSSANAAGTGSVVALSVESRVFYVSAADAELAAGGGGEIRATLVWMDPPVTAFSATQLMHDLDMFLEGPDGTVWTMSGVCSGNQGTCSLDSTNNVERIVVSSKDIMAGAWTVQVSAENDLIEGGAQNFALIVSFPLSAGVEGTEFSDDSSSTSPPSNSSSSSTTPAPSSADTKHSPKAPLASPTPSPSAIYTSKPTPSPSTDNPLAPVHPSSSSSSPSPSSSSSSDASTDAPAPADTLVSSSTRAPFVAIVTPSPNVDVTPVPSSSSSSSSTASTSTTSTTTDNPTFTRTASPVGLLPSTRAPAPVTVTTQPVPPVSGLPPITDGVVRTPSPVADTSEGADEKRGVVSSETAAPTLKLRGDAAEATSGGKVVRGRDAWGRVVIVVACWWAATAVRALAW